MDMIRVTLALAAAFFVGFIYYIGWVNNPIDSLHLEEHCIECFR